MPPYSLNTLSSHVWETRDQSEAAASFAAVRSQWQNPTDILTVLMIIGGDVVQAALAQLVGSALLITPVAFSFGWVAYAFSAILAAVGTGKVTPEPDTAVTCINAKSGYAREVRSWVLARLYRDLVPPPRAVPPRGLTLLFFETLPAPATGVRTPDLLFGASVLVIVLQLGIACIPGALQGNWVILIITAGGTLLAQLSAALPQWRAELWRARKLGRDEKSDKAQREVVCLTAGNGSSHVVVVKSEGCGLKLEDLAGGRVVPERVTSAATFALAVLWVMHLITVQSVESDGWYLLAIGGIGMLQNVISAGARREPNGIGFHLREWDIRPGTGNVVYNEKVFLALKDAEDVERRVGLVLLDIFFPGGLKKDEEDWRKAKLKEYVENEKQPAAQTAFSGGYAEQSQGALIT